MGKFPDKCLIDTNVPKTANLAGKAGHPQELINCVLRCVEAITYYTEHGGLVMDAGDEIFTEYRRQLSFSLRGEPGVGDKFMKWVNDNRWGFPPEDRVRITKNGDTYNEFPHHDGLSEFDISDRKFVAVANAHRDNPPILQGTDSKWWGWQDALRDVGIEVDFLCPDYVKRKYEEKMGA